jgi:hypothetical protein
MKILSCACSYQAETLCEGLADRYDALAFHTTQLGWRTEVNCEADLSAETLDLMQQWAYGYLAAIRKFAPIEAGQLKAYIEANGG